MGQPFYTRESDDFECLVCADSRYEIANETGKDCVGRDRMQLSTPCR